MAAAAIVAAQKFSSQMTQAQVRLIEYDQQGQQQQQQGTKRIEFFVQLAEDVFGTGDKLHRRILDELLQGIYPEAPEPRVPYFDQIESLTAANQHLGEQVAALLKCRASKTTETVKLEHALASQKHRAAVVKREMVELEAKFRVMRSIYEQTRQDEILLNVQLEVYADTIQRRRKLWADENKDMEKLPVEHRRIKAEELALREAIDLAEQTAEDPADNSSVDWHLAVRMLLENYESRAALVRATLKDAPSFANGTIEIGDIPQCIAKLGIVIELNEFAFLAIELDDAQIVRSTNGRIDVLALQDILQSIDDRTSETPS